MHKEANKKFQSYIQFIKKYNSIVEELASSE